MNAQLLTTKQAAEFLGVSASFLEKDRWRGARIPFVQIAKRSIRYRQEDLNDYVEQNRMLSTSEYSK